MKPVIDCLLSNHGLAFATGTLIFLITIIFIATRLIGFWIALLLLLFALAASLSIANQDIIREYLQSHLHESTPNNPENKSTALRESLINAHGTIRDRLEA
jgi:hypothetical protein